MGSRSLAAEQQATEIAGQNLANVNNPAYARQRVSLKTSTPINTPIGPEGTGVSAIAIVSLRDALLDGQITSEASVNGSLTAQQTALANAQAALGEQIDSATTGAQGASTASSTQNGLAEQMSALFNAFQSLSTDPSSIGQRLVVIQKAQSLAAQFNQVAGGLAGLRTGLSDSIRSDVTNSNQDLQDIANLNAQIIKSEAATGGTANDLRDQRQAKLEDLAKMTNITTTSDANGGVDVSIGGVTMVSGMKSLDNLQAYDAGGGQILVRAQTAGTPLTLSGGSIEGTITARDGALATLQANVNNLAGQFIAYVNNAYRPGFDLTGATGQDLFSGNDAASIAVTSAVAADPSRFQASGVAGAAGDNTIVLNLAQLANTPIGALNSQTLSQSFASTVAGIGQSLASVNDQVTNQTAVGNMLQTQRSSVSGVSLDEEMTNLVQFQKAYEASAKLVSTVAAMMETVITMKAT